MDMSAEREDAKKVRPSLEFIGVGPRQDLIMQYKNPSANIS